MTATFTRRARLRLRGLILAAIVLGLGLVPAPQILAQTIEIKATDGADNCGGPTDLVNPFNRPSVFQTDVVCFSPGAVTINVGDTVTWVNTGSHVHNASAYDGSWSSPDLEPGDRWSHTFTQAGDISYVCAFHSQTLPGDNVPTGQAGKLTVTGSPEPTPTPTPSPSPTPSPRPTPTPTISPRPSPTPSPSGETRVLGERKRYDESQWGRRDTSGDPPPQSSPPGGGAGGTSTGLGPPSGGAGASTGGPRLQAAAEEGSSARWSAAAAIVVGLLAGWFVGLGWCAVRPVRP